MKEYLSQKGIDYKSFDVASDSQKRQEMSSKTGSMSVPTLLINGKTVIGFDRNKIDELLH
ncbi:MAG TPA: glutaredoxin domain-containing protein [Desulfobacteria bacterium]|nr:glutaredoxin domain-containing protein [Desulfobacteria bacterium]